MVAAPVDPTRLLAAIEKRYNEARTLEVVFEQTYSIPSRGRRTESGRLYLRKPGRMRWEYSQPPGKLFLSDGKDIYLYSPSSNRVEKMRMKQSDDLRAPLAFLLGKVDFRRDFGEIRSRPEGDGLSITASPKSDKMPYRQVDFLAGADGVIRRLKVLGVDQSVMEFRFEGEKRNPPLADKLFQFVIPAGVELVQGTVSGEEPE